MMWAERKCQPCEGKTAAMTGEEAARNIKSLSDWRLSDDAKFIRREFVMKNFVSAVECIQKIAEIAEGENHHPDIHLTGYRKLAVELTTHAIGGLSDNDFIVAAKISNIPKELKNK